ncbi:cytospin-A isoform X3 [Ixodes scapularis]|uniref:cytospin-A isoform X3 n=1 Tax=Ixodes scapularis TaxID=6945 RepID=UPI001C38DD87|nr:cytospin-A isoform X3 [Ixodes scapularis]
MMRNARTAGGTLRSAGNSAVPERGLSTLQRARAQAQENIFNATKAAPRGPSAAGRARSNRPTAVGRSDPVNKENMMSQAGPIARKAGSIKSSSSKDSLDSNGQSREQRKARPGLCQAPTVATQTPECGSGEKASPTTILQQEREKALLEQQVSELVRNAESKKAEIATLRMEIKHLKEDRASGDRWQLEALQEENRRLRDKLLQMGAPIEQSPLSDSDKEQLLLGRSASGSMASLDGVAVREQAKSTEGALSDADVGDSSPGGARLEWDKASTSSLSEMSVACLQDRIMQMEETHYSTNEELQATLQELTDLQDQLTDLQLENERCGDEKSLLLESLCSQTEKLEECRSQNEHLRVLLFQQACPREQPREHHYVELLKKSHEEQQCLRGRVEQLESALEGANREAQDHQRDLGSLAHRVSLLQAALDATHPPLLGGGGGTRPPSRSTEDEQQQRKRAEEEEEEERQREQGLQEQLALAQREATRLSELLSQVQDETQAAHAQVSSLEQRVEQLEAEKAQLVQECEAKCQRQLEDKRQLRAQVGELQNRLADTSALLGAARRDLQDLRSKHLLETEEWKQFEVDLLTTVRVANDFKTESQQDVERLQCDNQQLQEKLEALEAQLAKLKQQNRQQELSPKAPLPDRGEEGAPPEATPHGASPLRKPLGSRWGDLRPSSSSSSAQHSVRSLIESIENATKQAKGPSSRSSSTSSLNSLASDSRSAAASALLAGNTADIFAKPCLKAEKARLQSRQSQQPQQQQQQQRADGTAEATTAETAPRGEAEKPLPMSILSHKLEPIRRNSYSDLVLEKKDPLAFLVKGGGSKRNALLKWCQNKTLGYKNIDITNFSSSWNDGLAFCALLHTYIGDKIPYDQLDSKDKRRNFSIAFEAAESVGIPSTLIVSELIALERPDWQSIMAYVTSIYKHFET